VRTAAGGDLVQGGDGGVGIDRVRDQVGPGFAGELVHHVQDLQHPPGGGDIELVVQRPHLVGPGSGQPISRRARLAQALAFATPLRHPQTLPRAAPSCGSHRRGATLGGAVLADDPARPPLRQSEPVLDHDHGTASLRRAHQFPVMMSTVSAGVV
jgi:hypothetical protein